MSLNQVRLFFEFDWLIDSIIYLTCGQIFRGVQSEEFLRMSLVTILIGTLLFCSITASVRAKPLGCLNGNGEFVDWWVIYKESNGLHYVYMDSTLSAPRGLDKYLKIDDSRTSPIIKTIKSTGFHLDGNFPPHTAYMAWNDQPSKNYSVPKKYAHAKVRNWD